MPVAACKTHLKIRYIPSSRYRHAKIHGLSVSITRKIFSVIYKIPKAALVLQNKFVLNHMVIF
jgi:hypothetical protein